jgi:hypothetical protein
MQRRVLSLTIPLAGFLNGEGRRPVVEFKQCRVREKKNNFATGPASDFARIPETNDRWNFPPLSPFLAEIRATY